VDSLGGVDMVVRREGAAGAKAGKRWFVVDRDWLTARGPSEWKNRCTPIEEEEGGEGASRELFTQVPTQARKLKRS
jgi:hypothetical protein